MQAIKGFQLQMMALEMTAGSKWSSNLIGCVPEGALQNGDWIEGQNQWQADLIRDMFGGYR